MKSYKSKSGKKSGVTGYEIGRDYITVRFETGNVYTYSYFSTGEDDVEAMKKLASESQGLSTYISRYRPPFE